MMARRFAILSAYFLLVAGILLATINCVYLIEIILLDGATHPIITPVLHQIVYPTAFLIYAIPCLLLPFSLVWHGRKPDDERSRFQWALGCYDQMTRALARGLFKLALLATPALAIVLCAEHLRSEPIYWLRALAIGSFAIGMVFFLRQLLALITAPLLAGLNSFQIDGSVDVAFEIAPQMLRPVLKILAGLAISVWIVSLVLPLSSIQLDRLFGGTLLLNPIDYDWYSLAILIVYSLLVVLALATAYGAVFRALRHRRLQFLSRLLESNRQVTPKEAPLQAVSN